MQTRSPEMPERPGGGAPWRRQHIEAARMRAAHEPWQAIADALGFSYSTVAKYNSLDGFADLIGWFEYKALEARREAWLEREETLIFDGVEAMHACMISIMRGEPQTETRVIDGADTEVQVYPSPYVRSMTASGYAKMIGYEEAKRLLAQRAIQPKPIDPLGQLEHDGYLDAEYVDASIDYGDDDEVDE